MSKGLLEYETHVQSPDPTLNQSPGLVHSNSDIRKLIETFTPRPKRSRLPGSIRDADLPGIHMCRGIDELGDTDKFIVTWVARVSLCRIAPKTHSSHELQ